MSEAVVRAVLAATSAGCSSALDVGSGPGKYPAPVSRWETVDAGLVAPKSHKHHSGPALRVLQNLRSKSFDLVYALDFIEHLEKSEGWLVLAEMRRVAFRRVLVFTPNGFREQAHEDPLLRHYSGWTPEDLRSLGFVCSVSDFDYGQGHGVEPGASLWGWLTV